MARIDRVDVSVYTFPTDQPESDGTLAWDSTTIVLVEAHADGQCGLGYTYTDRSAASLIDRTRCPIALGRDAFRIPEITGFMKAAEVADAFQIPISAHTAPVFHLPACCFAPRLQNPASSPARP